MGIIAYCPQGHRTKVKDFLAGKRGVCPTCGVKFRIPEKSGEPLAGDIFDDPPPVDPPRPAVGVTARETPRPAAEFLADLPTARQLFLEPGRIERLPRAVGLGEAEAVSQRGGPPADLVAPPAAALPVAVADRPDLLWSIAAPGGDPSEPITAEQLLTWLESGGVRGDEYLWRSDWPEWRPLVDVFPDVGGFS